MTIFVRAAKFLPHQDEGAAFFGELGLFLILPSLARPIGEDFVDPGNEPIHLMLEINPAIDLCSGAIGDVAHFSGKQLAGRHHGPIQQYRNDGNISLKRSLDFDLYPDRLD